MFDQIFGYVILGLAAVVINGWIVLSIIKIVKLPTDQKKEMVITYLKGLVALAEKTIGSGHGQTKLAMVEDYFNKNAPMAYKTLLFFIGKENLRELIETALAEIKESF